MGRVRLDDLRPCLSFCPCWGLEFVCLVVPLLTTSTTTAQNSCGRRSNNQMGGNMADVINTHGGLGCACFGFGAENCILELG